MRCIIIDDEPLALAQMENYLSRVSFLECVAVCNNVDEAMQALSSGNIDVMFTDINMPGVSGLQLVQNLPKPPKVVFTTAYAQYAIDGFKINAMGYLLKPYGFEEFLSVANKVYRMHLMEKSVKEDAINISHEEPSIFVKSDYKMLRIPLYSIKYIESMSEYVRIFIDCEPKPVITLLSMKKIEEHLPANTFMRVHRSYIVNLSKIKEISRMRIVYDNNVYIPVGEMYKDKLFEYIDKHFIGKL